jgi:hypothetical protein
VREIRADDVLAELLLLQQLEHLECRGRKRQVLQVRRARPVLQVVEVGDEGRVGQELARGEVVEVLRVRERLDELLACQFPGCEKGGRKGGRTSSSSSNRECPPYLGSFAPSSGSAGGSKAALSTDMGPDSIVGDGCYRLPLENEMRSDDARIVNWIWSKNGCSPRSPAWMRQEKAGPLLLGSGVNCRGRRTGAGPEPVQSRSATDSPRPLIVR